MTVVRAGHPLRGWQLRVDPAGGQRRDGRVQVVLPNGSTALMPITWVEAGVYPVAPLLPGTGRRFTIEGLRHLVRLVDSMSRDSGKGTPTP